MSWAKVDDGWWSHPKVLVLSLPARGLWVTALSWSCAHRRDIVPGSLVAMVGGDDVMTQELVDVGLWKEVIGGFQIHDWVEYQDRSVSEKRAEAGRKGGLTSRNVKQTPSKTEANAKQNGFASGSNGEAKGQAGTRPVPSLPKHTVTEPTLVEVEAAPLRGSSVGTDGGFDEFWGLVRRKAAKADAAKAWTRAVSGRRPADPVLICDRWRVQLARWDREGRPLDKHPHAATWLNGRRWEDDDLTGPAVDNGDDDLMKVRL